MHRHSASRRVFAVVQTMLLVAWLAACGAGGPTPAATVLASPAGSTTVNATGAPQPGNPATIAAARARIDAARLDDPASIAAVDSIRFGDGAAAAAAEALADGAQGDARWAATWVYASSGTDAAPLRPLLDDADLSVRAMAAAALVAWGDPLGIPALGGLAGESGLLRGSIPPVSVSSYAAGTLARFVGGPVIGPGTKPAAVGQAWLAWLAGPGANLRFDPASGTWSGS
jgi:hypothetical protein